MYNSGRRGKRASDGYGIISQADKFYQTEYSIPVVTSFAVTDGSYVPLDDTAVDTAGGQTIVLYGSGFAPGATVTVGGVTIGAVTYLDQGRLTFTAPAKSSGSYTVVVINSNGGAGILVPGLVYSGVPVWSTSAGSVGSVYETTSVSSTFVATGDAPMTYSVLSGSLPPGTTLSTTGVLSGSAPVESGSTTYSFTIRATDGQLQDTDRSFSLTVNTDLVTFSSPTNNQVITSYEYKPISNVTVAATSAAGYGAVYSANTIPTGITLNATSGVISGTANTVGNTYTRLTATANTTSRTATRDVVFNVNQDVVTWNTPTDNYTISAYEYSAISNVTANATSAAGFGVLYSANTTPTGITLDANTGLISGAPTTVGNTYSLLTATANTTTRSNTRNVIYNVNQDVVTWSSPADGTTYSLQGGSAIANVTLAATSAAGKSITYTANALPSGLGISGNVIYGTPDTAQTVTTLLTATAATTNRTATRTISWSISLGDIYWKYTSLLLNANTPTPTFINDASLNNSQLTIAGDTKPNNFNPYSQGYYSFNGTVPSNNTNGCITTPTSANLRLDQGNWTIEFWIYLTAFNTNHRIFDTGVNGSSTAMTIGYNSSGVFNFGRPTSGTGVATAAGAVTLGKWYHVALTTETGNTNGRIWINGVLAAGPTAYTQWTGTSASFAIGRNNVAASDWTGLNGYMSNFRFVSGQQLYTSAFTPDTKPLTTNTYTTDGGTSYSTITGTCQLLTLQDSSYKDKSLNNFLLTPAATYTAISPAHPFTTPTTAAYNTLYSTYFDGTSTTPLTISTGSGQLNLPGDFTVELWFYDAGTSKTLQQFAWSSGGLTCGINAYDGNSTRKLDWRVGGSAPIYGVSAITPYTWHHAAYVKSGSTFRIFLDGKLEYYNASYTSTFTSTTTYIGGANNGDTNYSFLGHISNFRVVKGTAVYTTASTSVGTQVFTPPTSQLTAVENTALLTCQNSTLIDNSTNALTITSSGNQKPVAVSPFTMTTSNTTVTSLGSGYFSASSAYTTYSPAGTDIFGTGDFTVECWFNPTSTTAVNISMASTATSTWELLTYANQLYWHENGGNLGGTGYGSIPLNAWSHLAVSRSGTTLRMFINGIQVYSVTNSYNYSASPATRSIGPYNGGSAPAYISDFRVIKGTALYTSNFLPPQAPLTAVANTQLLTCQTNGGATNNGFVDQSSFNNIITRNGNTTQGTFSPYSQTGWSTYYNGTSDYQYLATNAAFAIGTSDFTVEMWVMPTGANLGWTTLFAGVNYGASSDWGLYGGDSTTALYPMFFFTSSSSQGSGSSQTQGSQSLTGYTKMTIGQWNHVAVSRVSGTARMFLNGTQTGPSVNASTWSLTNTLQKSIGGGYNGNSNTLFTGYISNLRVISGTGLYSANFTPSTTPLTAVAGTILLTNQNNRTIDNSVNNFSFTNGGTPSIQAISPFGGVTSAPTSYSVYFDGTGDYLTANATTLPVSSANYTIECWFNGTVASKQTIIFWGTGTGNQSMALTVNSNGSVFHWWYANDLTTTGVNVLDGAWHHLVATFNGTTRKIYVDGVQRASDTPTGKNTVGTNVYIGYQNGAGGENNYLTGYISNLRVVAGLVYDISGSTITVPTSPLTAIANTSLLTCQSNRMIDNSTNYFTITAAGDTKPYPYNPFGLTNTSQVSYTPSVNGGSMYFDGTGDYLVAPAAANISGTGYSWTIQGWFYQTSVGAFTKVILDSWNGGQTAFLIRNNSNYLDFYITGGSNIQTATAVIKANTWYHFAVVKDINNSNTITMYLNGIKQGTSLLNNTTSVNTGTFGIGGATTGGSEVFPGYISDVQIIKGVALYTSNFYPPVSPLTPTTTIGTTTYSSVFLLNGTSGGIIDYHGTNNLETVSTQLMPEDPYGGSYYSNYFDGASYASISTGLVNWNADFCIEFWVNTTSGSGATAVGSSWNGVFGSGSFTIWLDNGAVQMLHANSSGTNQGPFIQTASTLVNDGKWHHVAITQASGSPKLFRIFVDGVLRAYKSESTWSDVGTSNYNISYDNATYTRYFTGSLSNYRITSNIPADYVTSSSTTGTVVFTPSTTPLTAISGTNLLAFQSNRFLENSSNARTVSVTGTIKIKSFNPFRQNTGKSFYFDGSTSKLLIPASAGWVFGTGDFTIEFWMNTADASAGLLTPATGGAGYWAILIYSSTLYWQNAYNSSNLKTASLSGYLNNSWVHVAIVRSSGSMNFYFNGVVQGTATADSTNYSGLTNTLTIGYDGVGNGYYSGYLKDLRITKGYARYTTTFTPPTTTFEVK